MYEYQVVLGAILELQLWQNFALREAQEWLCWMKHDSKYLNINLAECWMLTGITSIRM